jgi:hypothetical protein
MNVFYYNYTLQNKYTSELYVTFTIYAIISL